MELKTRARKPEMISNSFETCKNPRPGGGNSVKTLQKRRRSARGGFKMFIFSQNGHKDQNAHILEGPGTPKYTEILENPRRRFVFAHGGRRFTTFEAYEAFIVHYEFVFLNHE